jgi:hypothetical protein
MIIDKGLTDTILCSEGWDGPLKRMLQQASTILTHDTGQYLLISYRLPQTTLDFLTDVGNKVGLEWEYDIVLETLNDGRPQQQQASSTMRCTVSLATRKSN